MEPALSNERIRPWLAGSSGVRSPACCRDMSTAGPLAGLSQLAAQANHVPGVDDREPR
jgi:hypothetical protein